MQILDAVDAAGWHTDGRISALNSYENRVYSLGVQCNAAHFSGAGGRSLVAKFYRPGRWSDAAILEEHAYLRLLCDYDLPVVAPLAGRQGLTLLKSGMFRFCLYPRVGGRPPEPDNPAQLTVIGRTLGRLHRVGAHHRFTERPLLTPERLGERSAAFLLQSDLLPECLHDAYQTLVEALLLQVSARFDACSGVPSVCLHGDFHPGNLLWNSDGTPWLLDFDDTCMGPAMQDLWMFLSGNRHYAQARLADLLDGYVQFHEFDTRELALIEPLRTLRIIHHAAWIARRWRDPAFQSAFPSFKSQRFWDEHILSLKEQQSALNEPPLRY